jgi:hypothetical protein
MMTLRWASGRESMSGPEEPGGLPGGLDILEGTRAVRRPFGQGSGSDRRKGRGKGKGQW